MSSTAPTGQAGTTGTDPTKGRWLLVGAALLLQFSIGAVYAWSTIAKALKEAPAFELSSVQASLPFEVSIGMIFIGAYIGGRIQDRKGPRLVALAGGIIYGLGVLLAGFAASSDQLWLLVLGYGVIAGFGLGFAYIVPIAMLLKWFPDKRGLITGLAVGGFGFGAVLTSPVAQWLIDRNPDVPTRAFIPLGIAYLVMSLIGASFFRNPPEGYQVPGFDPAGAKSVSSGDEYTQGEALRTPQWYLLTAILTLNVTAGIALISQAAASATDIAGYSTAAAATVVGVLAVFNGGGRIVWAAASDKIGRMPSFALMLGLQGVCLLLLPRISDQVIFFVLAAVVYLCYGGGFGTMPATAGDYFGVKNAGAIYGLMLVGWSIGGVVGPLIASALIGEDQAYDVAYTTIGIIALVSVALTFITKVPKARATTTDKAVADTDAAAGVTSADDRSRSRTSSWTSRPPLVVVMGVSGVGKSAVGELLAARLGVEYRDGDDLHPAANVAAMRAGHALTEEQRRPWLEAVATWMRAHAEGGGVMSCSALRRNHRDLLTEAAPRTMFLHLTGDPELIRERMQGRRHFMPTTLLDSQLETLEPPGDDERHVTLDVADPPEALVERFLAYETS